MVIQITRNFGNTRTYPSKPSSEAANLPFRKLIPQPDHPKIQGLRDSDALQWAELKKQDKEIAYMVERLSAKHIEKPFKGFTSDGVVKEDVFKFADDEGAPTTAMVAATENLLSLLSDEQQQMSIFDSLDADEFRMWSNPELYVNPGMQIFVVSFPQRQITYKLQVDFDLMNAMKMCKSQFTMY